MCLKGIGLHAQSMMTILSSIVNMIGLGQVNRCDRRMSIRIFTLITNEIQKVTKKVAMALIWIC